ncbi:Reverse transcriptase (RNA-dependent DNA polymerase) [Bacillus mycoides]|uniref:Reverse transcriptase (RNA-dependent DNA polymerase) n=1 Tax=Bacillus mycoides TaxID=1405 RepID=A0A1E8BL04_BACMY|nr:group II intron reverse transcriptase/maturase [Bacillus mycoides]OFD53384.1 Reverse transcriptase (RNA-dependent DNA polymerase) [Bacillus mycoides]OFD90201.1 Reverse transcriptase (RNA-dependent DNA polymerase) [Bacillus mycoides]OFD96788.1 Reverse transcriptase (RNA-dependent DNA polymerase) [Bacillus mycoides]
MNTSERASAHVSYTEWNSTDWKAIQMYVTKLRQRIYRAEQSNQRRKVRKLQRLLLRSEANLLISIRRVTQQNKGKRTPGVDEHTALSRRERNQLYEQLRKQNILRHHPKPAKRIYIAKKNGKLRPLGIPTIKDRVYQNMVRNALEPQWESRFEANSYGFRPKRSTHDAIRSIFNRINGGSKKKWIFEGDFKGCFDHLNHNWILKQLANFPGSALIERWLQMGYMERNAFSETQEGTPQGGIISPLLANVALHGMEEALGITYKKNYKANGSYIIHPACKIALVRYADDFVVLAETKEQAQSIYERLRPYLKDRGLELSPEKTKVTHIERGFEFLGFSIRQYKTWQGNKLFIKPSKSGIQKAKEKIRDTLRTMKGRPIGEVIRVLNPIIRGYGQYWKHVVSKRIFSKIANYVFWKVRKHLRQLHPKKSWKWIRARYYKAPHHGGNVWVPTCPKTNIQLLHMPWIKIERHVMVMYKNSPDNPTLKGYWEKRDRKVFNLENTMDRMKLARKQGYRCAICKCPLQNGEKVIVKDIPIHQSHLQPNGNARLVHLPCLQ